jgi:hypothetical protein
MKILSIDIGIKNFAFCVFEKVSGNDFFYISKWDVVNISEEESFKCSFIDKNISNNLSNMQYNMQCNKPAKFKKNLDYFCLKHAKKQPFQIPDSELNKSSIQKHKMQKLLEIVKKYDIEYEKSSKKNDLISLINQYTYENYFQKIETTNANKVNLINIGSNIKTKFNTLFSDEDTIDYVIIENQIGPIANRMKTIQGMIVQYFIMSPIFVENIEFVSASNKLKNCNINTKTKYSDRKKIGIQKCLEIISSNHSFSNQLDYFNTHKKKDDLSDSFLQGLWFINDKKL